jgi:Bacterial Ig-like domain (group 2)
LTPPLDHPPHPNAEVPVLTILSRHAGLTWSGPFLLFVAFAAYACGDSDGGGAQVGPDETVASVTITPGSAAVAPTETVQLIATPRNSSGDALAGHPITWSSANGSVATVSEAGLVTGIAEGEATVTASTEGKSGQVTIKVEVPVAVEVAPSSGIILDGETTQLTATVKDAAGTPMSRTVSWTSSSSQVASVSSTGTVKGNAPGIATITASAGGKLGSASIAVRVLDVSGAWTLTEAFSDPALGLSCTDQASVTIAQNGKGFTGVAQQTGTCTLNGTPFDNSGAFDMTEGLMQQAAIGFTEPGQPACQYQGTLTGDPPTSASGTVSCVGDVTGLGHVNATGTWQIIR